MPTIVGILTFMGMIKRMLSCFEHETSFITSVGPGNVTLIDETRISFYQSPLILTELFQHNLINVSYLTACYLYQVMMTLHFLNDVANDTESTQKSKITS